MVSGGFRPLNAARKDSIKPTAYPQTQGAQKYGQMSIKPELEVGIGWLEMTADGDMLGEGIQSNRIRGGLPPDL
ncbi:hypothetical protein AKJ51_03745 [candidate division MSBL1 archaeon SCGC-AAA382A20]|uniref:Uncharacterized protein n=1 Tax=candidate division MSBL1 archaeon SCGC-AAA382A20 TaxID=1698280 RepID=A0A133VIX9_9EURY|nr:hypothetical protein AKJ51_03745 [candidate division MSBL1 archaeon SCGC-AAA382A20]